MYYDQPQLPKLPQHLKQQALDIANGQGIKTVPTLGTDVITINDTAVSGSDYNRYAVTDDIVNWCAENVFPHIRKNFKIGIQVFSGGNNYCPHIDGQRGTRILNYLIDTGGDNVETVWYQENGQRLYRYVPRIFYTFDNLEERQRVKFEQDSWFVIQGNIIHSVLNLTGDRVALSIGFSETDYIEAKAFWDQQLQS